MPQTTVVYPGIEGSNGMSEKSGGRKSCSSPNSHTGFVALHISILQAHVIEENLK
jgi:hypothetical protein